MAESPWVAVRPADALRSAFVALDAGFRASAAAGANPNVGASMVCALVQRTRVTLAHVGTCRAVALRVDGTLAEALTVDHVPGCNAERARLRDAGGEAAVGRVSAFGYTRSIGDAGYHAWVSAAPDVTETQADGSLAMLVLASSGAVVATVGQPFAVFFVGCVVNWKSGWFRRLLLLVPLGAEYS